MTLQQAGLCVGLIGLLCLPLSIAAEEGPSDKPTHGLVGLRPIPANEAGTKHNHGGSWEGMPTFEQQKGNYPFVAEHIDTLYSWVPDGDFETKRVFFEYYWGLSKERDVADPSKNFLIKTIKQWEDRGGEIEHILICREARLAVNRGWKDAELGPFKEDGRILSADDLRTIRKLFKQAHEKKLTKHDDYKLLIMVEEPSFFATDPKAQKIIKMTSGVAYEAHQFNRHWPLETGWSKPGPVVKGAAWTLDQGLEYVFYYGPILWKQDKRYEPFIERDWLNKFWDAGLPKHHPKMHYYLNTFPHHTGRGRPVGPETDPHSVLGFTKWLIEEIKTNPGPDMTKD
ncbi:MAG: hypothetical protein AB8C95_11565 [Phycisphaeraceae bacterium]